MQQRLVVIVGPTASGKTALAIQLARKYNGEIISADSRQVYTGLDIGTGKTPRDPLSSSRGGRRPTWRSRTRLPQSHSLPRNDIYVSAGIRHHLIDVASLKQQFTVAKYQKLAQKAIVDILRRGKLPIICGGTGLYVDTLVYRCVLPAVKPNAALRKKLSKKSTDTLFRMLQKLDPRRARTIDPHNPRRLVRALEIVLVSGKPVPQTHADRTQNYAEKNSRPRVLWIGINPSKKSLHRNIHKRLLARMRQGMVAEVKRLKKHGVSSRRLELLGLEYRYINRYLENKTISLLSSSGLTRGSRMLDSRFRGNDKKRAKEKMLRQLESAIRRYVKRQMTWFKRNRDIHWLQNIKKAEQLTKNFLHLKQKRH